MMLTMLSVWARPLVWTVMFRACVYINQISVPETLNCHSCGGWTVQVQVFPSEVGFCINSTFWVEYSVSLIFLIGYLIQVQAQLMRL